MGKRPRVLFLLIDGVGLGVQDPARNPLYAGACPTLVRLLEHEAVPIDACLGVAGLPQSATGQTTLLTGVNAAQHVGRHVEGFPGPALRELIEHHNLYDQLKPLGVTTTFANAYFVSDVADVEQRRLQSVTTVAALKAFGGVRDVQRLLRNEAVYHDLTRASLRVRGYDGPIITPEEAAAHLMRVAEDYDMTLFEYFLTDRAGHKADRAALLAVLGEFDRFLASLVAFAARPGCLLALTSDHGNVESSDHRGHTMNPVPFVALGTGRECLRRRVRSVQDVTPALVELYLTARAAHGVSEPGVGA